MSDMKTAIILAGGQGTRLRPMTDAFPKPLAQVANKPLLEHIVFGLREQGISQVALATGYKADAIESYFGAGGALGVDIQYFVEHQPLGSGGALRNVCDQQQEFCAETFLIANADVLNDVDLGAALRLHREKGALATLVCCEVDNPQEFGICEIEDDGRITAFYEKPRPGVTASRWANLALWIFEPQLVPMIEAGHFTMIEDDLFPQLLRDGAPLYAYRHPGYWLDVGTHTRYLQAQRDALAGRFPCQLQGRIIGADGAPEQQSEDASLLAQSSTVEEGAQVTRSVIGHSARVAANATVEDSVVYEGASVGAGAVMRRCVLGPRSHITDGVTCEDGMLFDAPNE